MVRKRITAALLGGILATGSMPVMAVDSFSDAFTQGDWKLLFRYRLELVDQEPFSKDATASTVRTRLNYKTAHWNGLSLFVEFDYITELFGDNYQRGCRQHAKSRAVPGRSRPGG